jgi:hypothetical protein
LATCAVLVAGLIRCGSATKQEQMQGAQDALIKEAIALQRCETSNGYSSERCAGQRAAYESDLAAFRAKYGK